MVKPVVLCPGFECQVHFLGAVIDAHVQNGIQLCNRTRSPAVVGRQPQSLVLLACWAPSPWGHGGPPFNLTMLWLRPSSCVPSSDCLVQCAFNFMEELSSFGFRSCCKAALRDFRLPLPFTPEFIFS